MVTPNAKFIKLQVIQKWQLGSPMVRVFEV